MKPKKKSFDFTKKSNQGELIAWKKALNAIPIKLDIDNKCFDVPGTEIEVSYEFLELDPDTWVWLGFLFKKGDVVKIVFLCNNRMGEEDILLPMINNFFKKYGLPLCENIDVYDIKDTTWQEAYDLLCAIAIDTKIPVSPKIGDQK